MKKATMLKIIGVLLGFSLIGSIAGAVAWFNPIANISVEDNPIEGTTEGAYFAYGDGTTKAKAYGITKPRHLYNLAWLTYLGYFKDKQCYFELGNDVSMSDWTIPPIGTSEFPFVGNFNGNGHIVSNCTISNKFTDFGSKHPGAVTSTNFKPNSVKIVGFFGIVGEYPNDSYTGAYSSAVNTVYDLGLENVIVDTYSADTLIGMAAGYVDADISNVAVASGSINVKTGAGTTVISPASNISDHSIVGYTTKKKDIRKVNETIYSVNVSQNHEFNANDDGDSQGWGGSVNMLDMYNRLNNINNRATQTTYTYRTTETYDADGNLSGTSPVSYDSYYRYSSRPTIGNFSFINSGSSYKYLQGGKRVKKQYYSYYSHSGRYITDGTNYLSFDGSSLGNSTDTEGASLWTFTNGGNYYTISTAYNGSTYYLYYNSGVLGIGTNPTNNNRRFVVNDSGTKRDIYYYGDSSYHLTYSSGWALINASGNPYYLIHDGNGHYMGPTSNYVTTSVTASSAVHFNYSTSSKGYFDSSNTSYFLGYYNDSYPVQLYSDDYSYYRLVNSSGALTGSLYGTGYLRSFQKNSDSPYSTTRYVKWNNNAWTYSTNVSGATSITIDYIDPTAFTPNLNKSSDAGTPKEGPDSYLDSSRTTSKMEYSATDTTYFPLNVVADGGTSTTSITNGNYDPKDSNTGYVISGSTIEDDTTITNGGPSLIRVSEYAISNISNSYNSSDGGLKETKIYTHDASNSRVYLSEDDYDYQKYDDSSSTLYEKVLKGNSNVYGLHFMSSQISMDHIVNASKVSILGTTHETYQLPVNSIDFNLKQKGYINFFSGTYFSRTVTSFFSLHQIFRSGATITNIKEIAEIYGNASKKNYSYAYKYTDGTFSTPYRFDGEGNKYMLTNPESSTPYTAAVISSSDFQTYINNFGYTSLFDTVRITNVRNGSTVQSLVQNALYYFEIPMNDGEYCLGSVDGGTGGYLIYLDIGANAAKTQRTIISEHFTITETTTTYPAGVAFIQYSSSGIDDTNSVAMTIPTGFAGKTLKVTRTGNTITVTENDVETLTGDLTYLGDSITIANNIQAKLKPKSTVSKDIKRLQYYDYNVNLEETVHTIITETTSGNSTTRVVEQYDASGNAVSEANWKIYRTSNGNKYDASEVKSSVSMTSLDWTNPGSTVLISFYYLMDEDTSCTETLTLNVIVDTANLNGQYYAFNGYAFVATPTGGTITIKVLAKGNGTITINGTTVTSVGQTITISAS